MKLPDIPRAAATNIGLMAEKLIFERDFSVVGALLDELKIQDRHEDACRLTGTLNIALTNAFAPDSYGDQWKVLQMNLLYWLWFDVFDMNASLMRLAAQLDKADKQPKTQTTVGVWGTQQYTAGSDIQAGQMVHLDDQGRVVPVSPIVREFFDEAMRRIEEATRERDIEANDDSGMDLKDK